MAEMEVSRIQELEMTYGVLIAEDALTSAAHILQECGNDPNVGKMQVVERACQKLRKSLDLDDEESNLDWDEYCVDRAFVELVELRKEKYADSRSQFLPTVEREYSEMRSKWECFTREWGPHLTQMRDNSNKRVVLLRDLRRQMVSFMEYSHTNTTTTSDHDETTKLHLINKLLPSLTTANTHLQHTIPTAFKQTRLVRPSHVAQVASSMTGLFLRYFESPFYQRAPLHEQLKSRSLSDKLVMLDDVIHKIACALSKRKPKTAAIFGSFLFLGSHGRGRKRLARTLAEEIYDDKDRFLRIDMSEYKETCHVSRLIKVLDRDKRRGSVVMFENVENGGHCSIELLSHILTDGRVRDENGVGVDFSHDLILVSSHIGHEAILPCRCYEDALYKRPFLEILKEAALLDPPKHYNVCELRRFFAKVTGLFELEFMDLFDDVIVFPWMRPQDIKAIARQHMRDVGTSVTTSFNKKLFLYPSHAALLSIYCAFCWDTIRKGAHAYMTWYKVHMDPLLKDNILIRNDEDDMMIIYIDVILGLDTEFSLRVETSRHLEKYLDVKRFKQNLWKLRKRYRREKQLVDKIYKLQKSYLDLLELIHADVSSVVTKLNQVVKLIDDILIYDIIESELVHVDEFSGNTKLQTKRRAKSYLKRISTRLRRSLKLGDKATLVVIKSLLRRLSASQNDDVCRESCKTPTSFLCLGLTSLGKEQFAKSLAQHLVVDDGEKLLIEVDLSQCMEAKSFFRCAYDVNSHSLLVESVRKNPHSVIVFYKLETAHISVFSKIMSILEVGVAEDDDGNEVYFGDAVVVIVSDVGNKEMIGGLNGRHCYYMVLRNQPVNQIEVTPAEEGTSTSINEIAGFRGMRCELLNVLDYMLLFDPISNDQLNVFAKLVMTYLEKKLRHIPLLHLFRVEGDERFKRGMPYATSDLLNDITRAGGKDVIVRYAPPGLKIPPHQDRYIYVPY